MWFSNQKQSFGIKRINVLCQTFQLGLWVHLSLFMISLKNSKHCPLRPFIDLEKGKNCCCCSFFSIIAFVFIITRWHHMCMIAMLTHMLQFLLHIQVKMLIWTKLGEISHFLKLVRLQDSSNMFARILWDLRSVMLTFCWMNWIQINDS